MEKIAIIGYSAQVGNALNTDDFWDIIVNNKSSINKVKKQHDDQIPFCATIKDATWFDCDFFEYTPSEAKYIDPQQRIFLKHAWKALEVAGECNLSSNVKVGVLASSGINTYLLNNILSNTTFEELEENPFSLVGNSSHFLSTRIAYKLNCRGVCATIQSGCSSSLVALHFAKNLLLSNESDLMIVGGVHIPNYEEKGYVYMDGGVCSKSGKCRAFDINSDGTIFTPGVGVLILKRLSDAKNDGNTIYGIIEGSNVNNDGADKGGFTAPSLQGQIDLVYELMSNIEIKAADISYLETHGTATTLGDTIEYAALSTAYKKLTNEKKFCKIGALKNNIGHTDVSAGVLSIIKIILSFKHNTRPGIYGFDRINERLSAEGTPFIFSKDHEPWPSNKNKIAAITALGIGGTNAHVVISEYSDKKEEETLKKQTYILQISAKNSESLDKSINALDVFLQKNNVNDHNVAFSLNCGRKHFDNRALIYLSDSKLLHETLKTNFCKTPKKVIFVFPGQGCQYQNMARDLYNAFPKFRETFDYINKLFVKDGLPCLVNSIFSTTNDLKRTLYTQTSLFCIEYALADFFINFLEIIPETILGHSLGEYVCYAISGIMSLEEAIYLIGERAKLFDSLHDGAMLSVNSELEDIEKLVEHYECDIAAHNADNLFSISGLKNDIEKLKNVLTDKEILFREIYTSAAFHSKYMNAVLDDFKNICKTVTFSKGNIPIISNVTGDIIDIINSDYLQKHMLNTVAFKSMANTLKKKFSDRLFLEIGPGRTMSTLLKMNDIDTSKIITSMKSHQESAKDDVFVLNESISNLWLQGVDNINLSKLYEGDSYRKINLPTYSFKERECYIKPNETNKSKNGKQKISEWFYQKCLKEYLNPIEQAFSQYKKDDTSIDKIKSYTNKTVEHLLIDLAYDTNIDCFIDFIELIQNYSNRIPNIKNIDFICRQKSSAMNSLFKSVAKCIPQEMSFILVRFIEFNEANEEDITRLTDSNIKLDYFKYIDRKVHSVDFVRRNFTNTSQEQYENILIIGGFGRMSRYYTSAFYKNVSGKIILASRSLKNDVDCSKRKLDKNWENFADKIVTCNVDITDYSSLENAMQWINENIGKLSLIIHAAGVPQSEHMRKTNEIDAKYVREVLNPKIIGLNNLAEINKNKIDIIIVSSISSILGGISLLVYSSSHDYIDEFAYAQGWTVHNWDALSSGETNFGTYGALLNSMTISDSEGAIVPSYTPLSGQTIISTVDLSKRVRNWIYLSNDAENEKPKNDTKQNERPHLKSVYIPPTTEIEHKMHELWCDFLGFDRIGINDNFFELGGDSLQALRIIRIIAKKFSWPIKTVDLFEFPTISGISNKYSQNHSNAGEDKEILGRVRKKQEYFNNLKKKKEAHYE